MIKLTHHHKAGLLNKTIFKRSTVIKWFYSIAVFSSLCILFPNQALNAQYDEKYRPQFHFSPRKGWVGDPDGLIKFRGKYHLFWWGHATSEDLVHWQELPYPMKGGDGSFHYFSGSVVVDKSNSAGFGDSSMIAVYTMHKNDNVPEAQALSISTDGVFFNFYKNNPVLDIGSNSFRDPQVFWYSPANKWIMAVAKPREHKVGFYSSKDLKQWDHLSDFGPMGAHSSDWEVPDLFQLPVDGDYSRKKWVLTIGQGPNRMQYFLGDFNGTEFIPDEQTRAQSKKSDPALWIDYGTDFYAARTWRNEDDTAPARTTLLAWMGNWDYARRVPTSWGKGFLSVPRDITLKTFTEGIRLVQAPIAELRQLRKDSVVVSNKIISGITKTTPFAPKKNVYEIEASFDTEGAGILGFNLLVGNNRKLVVGYDTRTAQLFIDRTNCTDFKSDSVFNKHFPTKVFAPLVLKDHLLKLHILVDQSSVEVFANGGKVAMSAATFPAETQTGIELFVEQGKAKLIYLKGWSLSSIWR